jgi:hypothetical protein
METMSIVALALRVSAFTVVILVNLLPVVPASSHATEYDVCARGIGDLFTRTAHVQVSIAGPELGQDANAVLAPLVNRLVWGGQAEKVFVENYNETLCFSSLGEVHQITLTITLAELDEIKNEVTRGERGETPTVAALSQRATVSTDLASTSSEGKHPYFTLRLYYATNRRTRVSLI